MFYRHRKTMSGFTEEVTMGSSFEWISIKLDLPPPLPTLKSGRKFTLVFNLGVWFYCHEIIGIVWAYRYTHQVHFLKLISWLRKRRKVEILVGSCSKSTWCEMSNGPWLLNQLIKHLCFISCLLSWGTTSRNMRGRNLRGKTPTLYIMKNSWALLIFNSNKVFHCIY